MVHTESATATSVRRTAPDKRRRVCWSATRPQIKANLSLRRSGAYYLEAFICFSAAGARAITAYPVAADEIH